MTGPQKPRFPVLSDTEAHLRQTTLAAINGRRIKGRLLRASFPRSTATEGPWFCCADDIAFRILRIDEHAARIDAQDGPAMAMLLDQADPLLSDIEAALGMMLDASEIAPLPTAASLVMQVDMLDGDDAVTQVQLALSPDASLLPVPAPFAPALLDAIPLPARIMLDGPRLSPDDAASLASGDLLLIGAGPLPATISLTGVRALYGHIHPAERLFRPTA